MPHPIHNVILLFMIMP